MKVFAIGLLCLAASCSSLRPVPGAGLGRVEGEWLGHARVVLRDGTELSLEEATIRPESVIGRSSSTSTRWAVPRSDVVRVDTRRTPNTTTFLLGLVAPVAFAWLWAG